MTIPPHGPPLVSRALANLCDCNIFPSVTQKNIYHVLRSRADLPLALIPSFLVIRQSCSVSALPTGFDRYREEYDLATDSVLFEGEHSDNFAAAIEYRSAAAARTGCIHRELIGLSFGADHDHVRPLLHDSAADV